MIRDLSLQHFRFYLEPRGAEQMPPIYWGTCLPTTRIRPEDLGLSYPKTRPEGQYVMGRVWEHLQANRGVCLILDCFQDETNCGRLCAWQDLVLPI